jgi:hypothetical protein
MEASMEEISHRMPLAVFSQVTFAMTHDMGAMPVIPGIMPPIMGIIPFIIGIIPAAMGIMPPIIGIPEGEFISPLLSIRLCIRRTCNKVMRKTAM